MIQKLLNFIRSAPGSPAQEAMLHYQKGVDAMEQGKPQAALGHFHQAIKHAPKAGKLYHHRGGAFAEMGKHREAIVDYDVAVRMQPSYPDTYLDRGNSRHAVGELDHAIKDYSEAIRLNPNFAEAYANRAVIYAQKGNQEASEQDAEMARSLGIDQARLEALLTAVHEGEMPKDASSDQ